MVLELGEWEGDIERALGVPARYVDVTAQSSATTSIVVKDGVAKDISTGSSSGINIRVLDRCWGFASSNAVEDAYALASRAYSVARRGKREIPFQEAESVIDEVGVKPRIDPEDSTLEEKKGILHRALDAISGVKEVVSSSFSYYDSKTTTIYANSEGSWITANYPRIAVFSSVFVKKDGKLQVGLERLGATAGLEAIEGVEESAVEAAEKALRLLDAKEAPAGRFKVVLDPKLTGVFIHEALGHAVEADHVIQEESILSGMIGEQIASRLVTVYDDPTLPNSFGFYHYDSEGVKARKKALVEGGVLREFLHSRETASELGQEATGNARSQGFSHPPIVRMSNTYMGKGDFDFEELVDIKRGVYLRGSKGGEVDTTRGVFQFSAEEGFLIEDGEVTAPIRDVALSGSTLDILRQVDGVGSDFGVHIGFCGKAMQSVPVGDGGPHMRTVATVGGTSH
ncbi:MAG: TldD/PmbA family protein [Candidatus Hydrothermarchaeaceae archaeon]